MPWKIDDNGQMLVDEKKNPIWINEANEEKPVDYTAMSKALATANREAAERKAKLNELAGKYEVVGDIEDLSAWRSEAEKALEMAKNAPDKDKAIEEQLQARVKAATDALNAQLTAKDKSIAEKDKTLAEHLGQLEREKISHSFFKSPYANEKLASASLAESLFARRFALKDGALVGMDEAGQQIIYGDDGTVASFDYALAKMVEACPDKNLLLKGSDKGGSGALPSSMSLPQNKTPATAREKIEEGLRAGLLTK